MGGEGEREIRRLASGSSSSSKDKSPHLASTLAIQRVPSRLSDSRPTSASSTGVSSVPRGVPRRSTSGKWHVEVEVEREGGAGRWEGRGRESERKRESCVVCSMVPALKVTRRFECTW